MVLIFNNRVYHEIPAESDGRFDFNPWKISEKLQKAWLDLLKKQSSKGLRPATLLKKRLWHRCFPEVCEISKNTFSYRHLCWFYYRVENFSGWFPDAKFCKYSLFHGYVLPFIRYTPISCCNHLWFFIIIYLETDWKLIKVSEKWAYLWNNTC